MSDDSNREVKLYMPSNVSTDKKRFNKEELKYLKIVLVAIIICAIILYILFRRVEILGYVLLIGGGGVYFSTLKDENTNQSLFKYIILSSKFMKEQKRYKYKYYEWWRKYGEEKN